MSVVNKEECISSPANDYCIFKPGNLYTKMYFTDLTSIIGISNPNDIKGQNSNIEILKYNNGEKSIIKIPKFETSDNIMYEGLVGFFLNTKSLKYPSFIDTYAIIKLNNEFIDSLNSPTNDNQTLFTKFKTHSPNFKLYKTLSEINDNVINDACEFPRTYAILIKYLNNTTDTLIKLIEQYDFCKNDLLYIFFQVYMTISNLSKDFTHYDLHFGNVLPYKLDNNKYIEYHYIYSKKEESEKEITFKSKYVAKIIDYGSCYFTPGFDINKYIKCKNSNSLSSFKTRDTEYINSAVKNESHDLRLIYQLVGFYTTKKYKDLYTNLQSANWIANIPQIIYEDRMGTPEKINTGLPNKNINNVNDAYIALQSIVKDKDQIISNNIAYTENNNMVKIGDLYIYDDGRDMKYLPTTPTTVI
jgi:hypothetical protein